MDAKQIVAALGALGQDTRLEVFRVLVQCGPHGLAAGAIAQALGVPPSSLTFHLQQLYHAGLITQRRLGRQLIYAADFAAMNEIVGYLTESPGFSAFVLADGAVYQTYQTWWRGLEFLMGYYPILDRAPKGRDEDDGFQLWIRRHDEYGSR